MKLLIKTQLDERMLEMNDLIEGVKHEQTKINLLVTSLQSAKPKTPSMRQTVSPSIKTTSNLMS